MTTVNKAAAFTTLNTFADSRVTLIKGMRDAGYTLETARGVVIEWACGKMGSGDKGFKVNTQTGKVTMVTKHAKYETTKTVVRDVMLMMAGTTRREASASREVDLVAEAIKAYGKLNAAQKRKFLASV
jgi:hypothetical protein